MTGDTTKYRLIIKTTGSRMLYPIINTFCSDSGLSFNDAKDKLTSGAALEFLSKEQADNAAAKYRKLGCSVEEEQTIGEDIQDARVWICAGCGRENELASEKCGCGYNLYQENNDQSGASIDNKPSDEESTGFAGIGKRLDDLKTNAGVEEVKAWKQVAEEPQQQPEPLKQEPPQKVYTPKVEKKPTPSSRFSFAKVFWIIVGLIILISIFSKGSNNTGSSSYTPTSAPSAPVETQSNYPSSTTTDSLSEEMPPVGSGHNLSNSQIRYCVYQNHRIEIIRGLLDLAISYHVNKYNELVNDYNSRCSSYRYREGSLQSIQQELGNANSQLQEEAKQLVSSWGYGSGSQNIGAATNTYQPEAPSQPSNDYSSSRPVTSEEKASMEAACNSAYFKGAASFNQCLNNQMAALSAGSSRPDFSRVTSEEKASMEAACNSAYFKGAASFNQCLNNQMRRIGR